MILSAILAALISLPWIDQPRLSAVFVPPLGFLLVGVGLLSNVLVAKALRQVRFDMAGLGTPERLVTTGPFAVMRHPSSIGVLLIIAGWYLMWRALYCLYWAVPVVFVAMLVENELEERNLEKVFGDEYRAYKKRVSRYFPRMARWRV